MLKRADFSREKAAITHILNVTRRARQTCEKVLSVLFSPASSESSHYPESLPGSRWKLSTRLRGCHDPAALIQLAPRLLCVTSAGTLRGSPLVESLACCPASLQPLCAPQVAGTGRGCSAREIPPGRDDGLSCLGSTCWGWAARLRLRSTCALARWALRWSLTATSSLEVV